MKKSENEIINNSIYNEEYYERGLVTGISGYINFTWMPELTIRMAHYFVKELKLNNSDKVLDFGCAKGYIVKALRLLDIDCHGVDVSTYAIQNTDNSVKDFCTEISGVSDEKLYENKYSWLISKDVFEHIPEDHLTELLNKLNQNVTNIFAIVPLASDDTSGKYIIPAYDNDITHVIIKSKEWWSELFNKTGWHVSKFSYEFPGCKENWTSKFPQGNGFFILTRTDK